MGKKVCTVVMDKDGGVTVTVENASDKITQTIEMNGTSIVMTVRGSDATSTVTQTAAKVAIACKQFEVVASETITMTSSKASTFKSDDTFDVKSAKDMVLASDKDISASGQQITVTGKTKVSLSGGGQSTLDLSASAAKLASLDVEVAGQTQVSVKGAMVAVKADASLNAESSGVATVKGSVTNIQGQLVNVG